MTPRSSYLSPSLRLDNLAPNWDNRSETLSRRHSGGRSADLTTQQTTAVERYRRPRGQHPKPRRDPQEKSARQLPEYLEAHEVDALIRKAPNPRARLLFLVE